MHFLFIMFFYQVIPYYGSDCNMQLHVSDCRRQHLVGLQRFSLLLLIIGILIQKSFLVLQLQNSSQSFLTML